MNQERIPFIIETMYELYGDPIKAVRAETGSARSTISKFFNKNKTLRSITKASIYETCVSLIEKKLKEREALDQRLDKLFERLKNRK